mmetsp:Transcript_23559/g.64992  ORF Transcript_23559/g.64992 Transcript_23559/m.64992 type:complete len:214 (+) Transcript_23559:45-686(+)
MASGRQFDLQIKLMMIGDQAVGKTAMLVRYTEDDFKESVLPTIGIDFKVKACISPARSARCRYNAHKPHTHTRALCTADRPDRGKEGETADMGHGRTGRDSATALAFAAGYDHEPPPYACRRSVFVRLRKRITGAPWASCSYTCDCSHPYAEGHRPVLESNVHFTVHFIVHLIAHFTAGRDQLQNTAKCAQLGPEHRGKRPADSKQDPRGQQV